MSFHVKRTHTAHSDVISSFNGARTTVWERPPNGQSVLEIQTHHNPSALLGVPDDKHQLVPPMHWHWNQEEFFTVREGRYIFTLEGKDIVVSASDSQPVTIPPRARHTFRVDPTCETKCVIAFTTAVSPRSSPSNPEDQGTNERFFRNLYSYLEDCTNQGVSPSPPQLLLFLHSAEVSLAFPWGPAWAMQWVSYSMGLVIGKLLGQYVLGYKESYPEYYDSEKEGKKGK